MLQNDQHLGFSSRLQRIHDNTTATRKGRPVHPRTNKTYQWTSPLDVVVAPLRTRSSRRERNVEHIGRCNLLARARSGCWRCRRPPRGTSPTASYMTTAAPSCPVILSRGILFLSRFDVSTPIIPTSLLIDHISTYGGGGRSRGACTRSPRLSGGNWISPGRIRKCRESSVDRTKNPRWRSRSTGHATWAARFR
jgi:hypothetical protein